MLATLRAALVVLGGFTLLLGFGYPLLVTGIAQLTFPEKANGSLIVRGTKVGSSLIGQPFEGPRYFWSRPSGTTPPYNGAGSTGTNLGPTNPALTEAARQRVVALRDVDPANVAPVPVDLVSSSASGLDPEISLAAAAYQVPRVARVRHLDEGALRALVARHTRGRDLGFFGEPAVNVLELNLELDGRR